ncbi:MAG: CPXCG motif-containing cysteine-rich protein [Luteimonas sp.]
MLPSADIQCPYCGEMIQVLLDDDSAGHSYIEDCQVCCRPITMTVSVDDEGELQVRTRAENEA